MDHAALAANLRRQGAFSNAAHANGASFSAYSADEKIVAALTELSLEDLRRLAFQLAIA